MKMSLLTPGPVNIHPNIALRAIEFGNLHHRSEEFRSLLQNTNLLLHRVLQIPNSFSTTLLSTCGTGTLESLVKACYATTSAESAAIVFVRGHFGLRLCKQVTEAGFKLYIVEVNESEDYIPKLITILNTVKNIKFAFSVHHETSLGCLVPFHKIYNILSANNVFLCVDMISSLGSESINLLQNEQCDAFASVSGKAMGSYAGVGIVGLSHSLQELILRNAERHSTLCLTTAIKYYSDRRETPFTPAVPLFAALNEALKRIEQEGLAQKISRHKSDMAALCELALHWGFKPLFSMHFSSTTRTFNISENQEMLQSFMSYLEFNCFKLCQNTKYNIDTFQLSSMGWFERPLNQVFALQKKVHFYEAEL